MGGLRYDRSTDARKDLFALTDSTDATFRDELGMLWQAVAAARGAVIVTDARLSDQPIVYANRAFERLTGYAPGEIAGRNCRFLQGPETDSADVDRIREAVRAGEGIELEIRNHHRDGTPFWNDLALSPVRSPDGELTHFVGFQADVTERRLLERRRDDAIGVAGHELKSPAAALKVTAQLLRRRLGNDEHPAVELLVAMDGQINRLTRMIDDLLDVTRLDHGLLWLDERPVDVDRLVGDAVEEARLAAPHRTITVGAATGVELRGDADRLGQVLTNLLSNAVRYSPDGTPVEVEAEATAGAVLIRVRDAGPGVPEAARGRIFDRFYRVGPSEGTAAGGPAGDTQRLGLGLGLYVSAEIVRRHGGTIAVGGEPGRGAVFTVRLPRR